MFGIESTQDRKWMCATCKQPENKCWCYKKEKSKSPNIKENTMFMIKRTDIDSLDTSKIHKTEDEAVAEAKRLAGKHALQNPEFAVYELVKRVIISATQDIKIRKL